MQAQRGEAQTARLVWNNNSPMELKLAGVVLPHAAPYGEQTLWTSHILVLGHALLVLHVHSLEAEVSLGMPGAQAQCGPGVAILG